LHTQNVSGEVVCERSSCSRLPRMWRSGAGRVRSWAPAAAVPAVGVTVSVPSWCTAVTIQVSRLATSASRLLLRVGDELVADRGVELAGCLVGGHRHRGRSTGPVLSLHLRSYVLT
jgi:hypothetical protein